MDEQHLLEVRGLSKHFGAGKTSVKAVEQVSFHVRRGETLGLVGESGSGKSTIARLVTRLEQPSAGQMLYQHRAHSPEHDLATLTLAQYRPLRAQIQMVFQDPYASLNPRMRIGQVLGEALDTHGVALGNQRAEKVVQLLEQVGLRAEHAQRFAHEFSGGQRQRIGIARALAVNPSFIVADEPLSALDVSIQAQIINLLGDLKEQLGLTLLFISHDLDVVEYLCDRVLVLYLGRVMEVAPTRQLFERAAHPYTRALLAAAPVPNPNKPQVHTPLSGDIPSPANPPSGCVFRTRCPEAIPACASTPTPLRELSAGHWVSCWRSEIVNAP
jgi:peptide/nickel transport system ATP-binding protein